MDDDIFIIDTTPAAPSQENDVPQYGVSRKSTELTKLEEKTVQRPRFQSNLNPCWNCGKTSHSIRDCRAETNLITVEWNKELQMLMKERQGNMRNSARYHDNEKVNKYAHIVPGSISPQLRKIMGLSENDLPPYIYQLRKHGYPKAWLRHASVKPSGINLYDGHGNEVADPDAEEGEILEEEDKIRYDLSKLVTFPGFNAHVPEGTIDNYDKMNAPPYSEYHSLDHMISDLQTKAVTEYRIKKDRINTSKNSSALDDGASAEKEIVHESQVNNEMCSSANLSFQNNNLPTTFKIQDVNDESVSTPSQDSQESKNEDLMTANLSTSSRYGRGRVLTCTEGTPILRSKSGHTRLPPAENFSKNICDVINFENLPESTGKFEKMRGLLKKVKQVLGLQKQDS